MSIVGTAKVSNVKMSLDKYVNDNTGTSEGLSIDFEGVPFDNTANTEWIQPRILDFGSTYNRQGSSTEYAESVDVFYNINIFVKKSGVTTSHRHYAIRDIVADYFKIGQDIYLRNYAEGGTTQIAKIRVRDLVTDSPIPETNEYLQYALAYNINWTRLTLEASDLTPDPTILWTSDVSWGSGIVWN
uniref:Uncharacterized protein n=1 Tax=viral metagenome TaxID=1070528 RepID=A0A6M3IP32_9ZZZZ